MEYPYMVLITYIETLANTSSLSDTIEWLKDLGMTLFEKVEIQEFKDLDEFKEKISKGEVFIPYFTVIPILKGDLLLFESCPFAETLWRYVENFGRFPPSFESLIEYYRENEDIAVSPFCIVHHFVSKRLGEKIRVGEKHVNITRLGSKSIFGEIFVSRRNIKEKELDENEIVELLKDYSCIYFLETID
ncbi:MAG: hypothetical protein ACE5K4_03795 [Candidatus Hydrothermarchaeota archaeon]